ncbi:hypothetical protein BH11VER1_BH11VER1_22920 [soil metagenome]
MCALLAGGLIALTGCDGPDGRKFPFKSMPEKRLRLVVAADSLTDPMRNYQVTLLERLIRTRAGVDLMILDAHGDTATQVTQLKKIAAEGVDCLMVFPRDVEATGPVLRSIKATGSLVMVLGVEVSADVCTTSLLTDERKLGQIAGEFVVSALKKKAEDEGSPAVRGRVVQLTGAEDSRVTQERSAGFREALKATPEVVLVHEAPANGNEKEAAERIKEALRLQKTFDVVYAQNDFMARGASAAIKEVDVAAREAMLVIGTDGAIGNGGGIEMLQQGNIEATVYAPPLVDKAWQLVKQVLDDPAFKTKIEKTYHLKPFVITLESTDAILRQGLPTPELESF